MWNSEQGYCTGGILQSTGWNMGYWYWVDYADRECLHHKLNQSGKSQGGASWCHFLDLLFIYRYLPILSIQWSYSLPWFAFSHSIEKPWRHCFCAGKVGGILASIPQALAASVLCFEWAVVIALGLWNLQHIRTSSFRNMIIVGVSLFLGFSIPAYFQQYQPTTSLMVPSYLVPFSAASDGPFSSGSQVCHHLMSGHLIILGWT